MGLLYLFLYVRRATRETHSYDIGTGENPIIFLKTKDLRRDGRVQDLASTYSLLDSSSATRHGNTLNFPQCELLY